MNCRRCGGEFGSSKYEALTCEFCVKALEHKIAEQAQTIGHHEDYIQNQEARILTLKTGNENIRAVLEKEIETIKEKIRTGPAEIIAGLERDLRKTE
jgi:predicted  nucleic acid-binding Zn-ribbon protein